MRWLRDCLSRFGGSAPATLGFIAVAPECQTGIGAAVAAPAIPAAESTLGSHPCVALSSAQVLPEWTLTTPPCNDLSANGAYPLNFVSHSRGSLQNRSVPPFPCQSEIEDDRMERRTGEQPGHDRFAIGLCDRASTTPQDFCEVLPARYVPVDNQDSLAVERGSAHSVGGAHIVPRRLSPANQQTAAGRCT